MAPEILIEGKYNEKSDMYSFGCILYELFNLSRYYDDRNNEEIKTIDSKKYNNKWQGVINSLVGIDSNKRMNINQVYDIILKEMKIKELQNKINNMNINNEILLKEFKDLQRNPIEDPHITIGLSEEDNIYKWRVALLGPCDTSYMNNLFLLEIIFPIDYPNTSPEIHFLTPIYHLNVNPFKEYSKPLGYVGFNTIHIWNPLTTIRKVLKDLFAIFYLANPDNPYSLEMANEYKYNRALYEEKAKYFT